MSIAIRAFIVTEFIVLPLSFSYLAYLAWRAGKLRACIPQFIVMAALLFCGAVSWMTQDIIDRRDAELTKSNQGQ